MPELEITKLKLEAKIDKINTNVESLKTSQLSFQEELNKKIEKMGESFVKKISKIEEDLLEPDTGLYSRLKELESFKKTTSKIIWALAIPLLGLVTNAFFKLLAN